MMNGFNLNNTGLSLLYLVIYAWSIAWKGVALWRAAKDNQSYWFIAILILNTVGLLELVYLFKFAKHKLKYKDLMFWKYFPRKNS